MSHSKATTPHRLPFGSVLLDRYVIGDCLGEGGYGITYAGFDTLLERKVALKECFPVGVAKRNASESLRVDVEAWASSMREKESWEKAFLNEARMLSRLGVRTPSVAVLDFFKDNQTAYIAMEYAGDCTLRSEIDKGEISHDIAALRELLVPVFHALHKLHSLGFVHLDVCPENIVIGNRGAVLVDFGSVSGFSNADGATSTQKAIPLRSHYSPPEQYGGGGFGPWTDVYALSATLYECLTGVAPPRSPDRVVGEQLMDLRGHGVALSPIQERTLKDGLALRRMNRIDSVKRLFAGLSSLVD